MIQLTDIHKSFGTLEVLKGISLEIQKGEVVSIVGPSGAGKTTLLQIMGTLDRADSGQVVINGTDVSRLGQKALARFRNQQIGFVFQFHQLLPEFTALENVMMPALIGGSNRRETRRRAQELLDFMGLTDRASHRPSELSGGAKQRVAVARALITSPAVASTPRTKLNSIASSSTCANDWGRPSSSSRTTRSWHAPPTAPFTSLTDKSHETSTWKNKHPDRGTPCRPRPIPLRWSRGYPFAHEVCARRNGNRR